MTDSNAIPNSMEDIMNFIRDHKKKQEIWNKEHQELKTELSVLKGKKAAWDLCRDSLEEQIFVLQQELGIKPNEPNGEQPADSSSDQLIAPEPQNTDSNETPKKKFEFEYRFKHSVTCHLDCIRSIVFYPSSDLRYFLATSSDDGTIRIINIEPGSKSINARDVHTQLGSKTAKRPKRKLKANTLKAVKQDPVNICSIRGHSVPAISLAALNYTELKTNEETQTNNFENFESLLISGALDGSIGVYKWPNSESALNTIYPNVNHHQIHYYTDIHTDAIWSIAPIPNQPKSRTNQISCSKVLSTSADGTLKLWDPLGKVPPQEIEVDEKPLLVSVIDSNNFIVACQNLLLLYYENFQLINKVSLKTEDASSTAITALAVDESEKLAFVGQSDGIIKILTMPQLQIIKEINLNINNGHLEISHLSFTPCQHFLIACCSDGTVHSFSLLDFNEKEEWNSITINHLSKYGEGALCAASSLSKIDPDDHTYFATSGADGVLHIYESS